MGYRNELLFWLVEFEEYCIAVIYDLSMDLQSIAFGRAVCPYPERLGLAIEVFASEELVDLAIHPILPRIDRRASPSAFEALDYFAHAKLSLNTTTHLMRLLVLAISVAACSAC